MRSVRLLCAGGCVALHDPYADHVVIHRSPVGSVDFPDGERREISTDWPLKIMLTEALRFLGGGATPKTAADEAAIVVRRLAEIGASLPSA